MGDVYIMNNILIFGDSYSTFDGYIPQGYETFYPCLDVQKVEQTWWARYIKKKNARLVENNSFGGSTICYSGYNGDCSNTNSFIYRYRKMKAEGFFERNKVDTVLVFGGTNDSWANAPVGEVKYSNWQEEDLFQVIPAICHFASCLKNELPNAEIIFIINTELKVEIQKGIQNIAQYYGIKAIQLEDIEKESGHPTEKGMESICEQLFNM